MKLIKNWIERYNLHRAEQRQLIKQRQQQQQYQEQYAERVGACANEMHTTQQWATSTLAPFRMQKRELYIASVTARLGVYKADGRGGYYGTTVSIPIAKGVRFRMGSGRVYQNKSWQYTDQGELHFTTERLIYNGSTENLQIKWDKVLAITMNPTGSYLYIDRHTGKDVSFLLDEALSEREMATVLAYQQGVAQMGLQG